MSTWLEGSIRRLGLASVRGVVTLVVVAGIAACTSTESTPTASQNPRVGEVPVSSPTPMDPKRRAAIRLELAANYYQQRQHQVALEEANEALRLDPDRADAWSLIGLINTDLGRRAEADDAFGRALRLAPNDSEVLNNYGWYLCQVGREKEGISRFLAALQNPLYQTPSKPLQNAGLCALRMGDRSAAEDYLLRAYQVDPNNPVAMFNLAQIYLSQGDPEKARVYAGRLNRSYEPSAQTLWLELKIERRRGDRDAWVALANRLRRTFPQSPETALLNRGAFDE